MRALLQASGDSVLVIILKAAGALLLPMLATFLVMQLSKVVARVDALPAWEKRLLVAVYAAVLVGIGHALGLALPVEWGALSSANVQAILTALLAYVLHRVTRSATAVP